MTNSDVGYAADNIFRQYCRYLGVAYILSFVAFSGAIIEACDVVPLWWVIAAALAIHGIGVVMFAASFRRPDVRWVRWSGQALTVGYGLAIATWPLVWNGNLIDSGYGMWFTQFNGVAAATAALVWRVRWSLPYLIYVVVSVQFVNDAVRTPQNNAAVLTEIAWSFCLCAMPYAITVAAIRSGRVLDATRAQSAHAAADTAATIARADERSRIDALTHDRVMSTLLAAARLPMSESLVSQAGGTLVKLEVLRSTADGAGPPMDTASTVREICDAVTDIDAGIDVQAEVSTDADYPRNVVAAIIDAAVEAVRNSLEHAGAAATRTATVSADEEGLQAHIVDNGVGFDPNAIRPDRLGVAGTIRGRMEHLPGGSATVISGPGQGTTIRLRWVRP